MMHIIIVDDEEDTLLEIEEILSKAPDVRIEGVYTDPSKALTEAAKITVDCAFIDIRMPDMNGFELGERLMEVHPELYIVFITAFNDYAAEAFDINAIDYVLKPVRQTRLLKSLDKIAQRMLNNQAESKPETACKILTFEKLELYAGKNLVSWQTNKSQELFAYLLSFGGAFVSKYRIIEDIMPEYELDKALTNLHTTVYRTRKTLNEIDNHIKIEFKNNSYSLKIDDVYYDVDEFNRLIEQVKHNPNGQSELLEKAIDVYRNDYLMEESYTWCLNTQENLRRKYVSCVKSLADFHLSKGEFDKTINILLSAIIGNYSAYDLYLPLFQTLIQNNDVHVLYRIYKMLSEKAKEINDEEAAETIKEFFFTSYKEITGNNFR